MTKPNRLQHEKSPYLLQHQTNPVDWYSWGEEAFARANSENKPIFLSIGYSTCYWCHVMAHDSFENEEVASLLNKHFVNIKVDREERPDIDQIYMDAVVALTGHGGWPMSVFLTPDLKPFFGGTFFPRAQFIELISKIDAMWQSRAEDLRISSKKITDFLAQQTKIGTKQSLPLTIFHQAYDLLHQNFDFEFGGFGNAPKFPPSMNLSFLLRYARRTGNATPIEMVVRTLDAMARGGIFDQLGGGFHRYSVDRTWFVPHFEKMLYDNALIATAYLEAWQLTKLERFKLVAFETLDYVLNRLTDKDGGFYSAEDAGHVGAEGDYYLWNYSEFEQLLSESELKVLTKFCGISPAGNVEQRNLLRLLPDASIEGFRTEEILAIRNKLCSARNDRPAPLRDDKLLTAWNGLTIKAMAFGFQISGDRRYLDAAQRAATFIQKHLTTNGELQRRYRAGESRFSACLEDYSYLIHGLVKLHEADFDDRWIFWAEQLQQKQDALFRDPDSGAYYYSKVSSDVILRKVDFSDSATPSPSAITAHNLLKLHQLTGKPEWRTQAEQVFSLAHDVVTSFPAGFSSLLVAYDQFTDTERELVVVAESCTPTVESDLCKIWHTFLPNLTLSAQLGVPQEPQITLKRGRNSVGTDTLFYLCENQSCNQPSTDLAQVLTSAGVVRPLPTLES